MDRVDFQAAARLFHYWCPVLLGWSVSEVVGRATGLPISSVGRGVLLMAIWAAYSFDRLIDPTPQELSRGLTKVLWTGFVAGGTGFLILLPRLPAGTLALLLPLTIVGLAYRRVKKYPMVKAVLVPGIWIWAGVALPLADGSWFGWRVLLQPVSVPLFLLIAVGCLLCDVKDVKEDRERGVQSLPAQLGVTWTLVIAGSLAVASIFISSHLGRLGLVVDGILLLFLAACRPLLIKKIWGPLVVDAVLSVPGFLIFFHQV